MAADIFGLHHRPCGITYADDEDGDDVDWSSRHGRFIGTNLGAILIAVGIWVWEATHGNEMTFAWGWLIGTVIYALMNGAWIFLGPERTE